jgi:hypothetical protein
LTFKIPYAALPNLLLHLKIRHKLPLLPKIYHLHNLLSIILLGIVFLHMIILQSLLLILPLLKIHQLNKLLGNILLHMFILWSLLTLPLLFKIHQLNNSLATFSSTCSFSEVSSSHYSSSSKSTN